MRLSLLLKNFRIQNGLTQEQLAEKIFVSHQTISRWENGINTPSIDNLLVLSDLYDISLDQLIRGSSYFRKPFVIGKKYKPINFFLFSLIWLMITLFLTGFGYQPFGVVLLVLGLGIFFVLPTIVKDYWIIDQNGLKTYCYPKSSIKKLFRIMQSLLGKHTSQINISYKEIFSLEMVYIRRVRVSPFDINPDLFFIRLIKKSGESIDLPISNDFFQYIPQAMSYIEKRGIIIIDSNDLVAAIVNNENIFEYMNVK